MKYVIRESELFGCDGSSEFVLLSAMDVWRNEQSGKGPFLSDVGLYFDECFGSVFAKLERSETGSFGVVSLYAKTDDADVARLGSAHRSDHAVVKNRLVPLRKESIDQILGCLEEFGVQAGNDLEFSQYLAFARNASDFSWLVVDWHFDAKDFVDSEMRPLDTLAPHCFRANLSDYQVRGSNWLTSMVNQGVGVILGDGMGLGKTVQTIKAICDKLDQQPDARALVVCPSALVENWRREIEKFTLGVDVQCHVGPDRSRNYRDLFAPVVITTYDVARIDGLVLSQYTWDLLILDEAQFIKNPDSQRTKAIKKLPRRVGIAMTGTPFENHMTDIWSLMDFCCPGYLGTKLDFISKFQDEEYSAHELGRIIAPLLLRRRLEDIPNDLPDLIRIPMPIKLLGAEAVEYDRRRVEYQKTGATLGAINKLVGDLAAPPGSEEEVSRVKYDYLRTVTDEVFGNGEKIIVFVQRLQSIAYLEGLYSRLVPTFVLTGDTPIPDRMPTVDRFSNVNGAAMLLCNPTVGGAGLNITAANHVFHFSPQWNPAVIDQADARAHRRGQKKPVVVHYPYYSSTIEEYMWDKVLMKRDLSKHVVVGNKGDSSANEIMEALSMSPIESM